MPPSFRPNLTSLEDRTVPAVTLGDVAAAFAQTDALQAQVQGFLSKRLEFHNVYTLDYWRVYAGQVSLLSASTTQVLREYQNALTAAAVNDPTLSTEIRRVETERYKSEVNGLRGLQIALSLQGNTYPVVPVPIPPGQPIPANPLPIPPAPTPAVDTTTNASTTGVLPDLTDPAFRGVGAQGLRVKDVVVGQGNAATAGQDVKVFYTGFLTNGTVFDGNRDKSPTTFNLNGVVQGFNQGIQGMQPGGVRDIFIPAALGYGAAGSGSSIPPNSDLVFEVKLISASPPASNTATTGSTGSTGSTGGTFNPTTGTVAGGQTNGTTGATTGTGATGPVTPEVGASNGTSGVSSGSGSTSGTATNNTGSTGSGSSAGSSPPGV